MMVMVVVVGAIPWIVFPLHIVQTSGSLSKQKWSDSKVWLSGNRNFSIFHKQKLCYMSIALKQCHFRNWIYMLHSSKSNCWMEENNRHFWFLFEKAARGYVKSRHFELWWLDEHLWTVSSPTLFMQWFSAKHLPLVSGHVRCSSCLSGVAIYLHCYMVSLPRVIFKFKSL